MGKINIFTCTRHNIENNERALFFTDNHSLLLRRTALCLSDQLLS